MDTLRFQRPSKGTTRLVAGRTGKAQEFLFDQGSQGVFATSNIHGAAKWNRQAGISFWVRGDDTRPARRHRVHIRRGLLSAL